VKFLTSLT